MTITLYGLDKCDTCRKARNWLTRKGIEHAFVDYRDHRVAPATLKTWAKHAGGWESLVNRSSTTWRTLPDARKSPGSDAEWTLLIKEYPTLVRRPVAVFDDGRMQQGFTDKLYAKLFS